MSNRIEKGNSLLQKTLSKIINDDLNDPRLNGEMVTVLRVSLSSDLKYAKVYVSLFGDKDPKEVLDALQNASGFMRKELKNLVEFRVMPNLQFVLDTSEDYGEKIDKILKDISYSDKE